MSATSLREKSGKIRTAVQPFVAALLVRCVARKHLRVNTYLASPEKICRDLQGKSVNDYIGHPGPSTRGMVARVGTITTEMAGYPAQSIDTKSSRNVHANRPAVVPEGTESSAFADGQFYPHEAGRGTCAGRL